MLLGAPGVREGGYAVAGELLRISREAAFALAACSIRQGPYPTVVGFADAVSGFGPAEYRLGGRSGSRKPRA